nr:PREDICTED: uncharacterized protein LOC100876844 [Megachile rotundata]
MFKSLVRTTHLKIDEGVVKCIDQQRKDYISKIPRDKLIKNCKIIRELNVSLIDLRHLERCLALCPSVVKRRTLVLKEMGVQNPNVNHIYRFPTSMRRSIKQFKKVHNIPPTQNIMNNIITNLGFTINKSSLKEFNCNVRAGDYYHFCMKYFKANYLNLNSDIFHKTRKIRYQSFQEVTELLNILQTKYNFDHKFLCKHAFLLKQDKNNIESYLSEFEDVHVVGKLNIIEVARKFPRILCYPSIKIKELLMLCKKLDIPGVPTISYLPTACITKEVFLIRYLNILSSYELSIWAKHPRVLKLIQYYSMVETRVEYLKLCNRIFTATIHTYLCSDLIFIRYVQGIYNRSAHVKYIIYILCKEFGADKAYLVDHIKKHSHWKTVPLLLISKTIEYLKKNYSINEICENIQLILYSVSAINKAMNTINEEYTSDKGYNFSGSQYLALCLYILEKEHHFNGDAVWQGMDTTVVTARSNVSTDLKIYEYEDVIKNLATNDKAIQNLNEIAWLEYLLR